MALPFSRKWSYDGNGNRVMEVKPEGTVLAATYDDQDRLLQYGESTFTSTHNGELLSKCQGSACQHFAYDVFGNLRHVILDSGIEIEYLIDGRNRRIGKKINGTLVQGFVYNDQLRIVAELDGQNNVVSRFIYADHINVPEIVEKGGRTYRILHDHLGSPRYVIDTQTGEIAQELAYDTWGNVVFDSNPGFQPFGFAGGLYDPQTKLLRFGARDYDPHVGRWTSKDPLAFSYPGGWELFASAFNDPLNVYDPSGLSGLWEICRFAWKTSFPIRLASSLRCFFGRMQCNFNGEVECIRRFDLRCLQYTMCLNWVHACCDREWYWCQLDPFTEHNFNSCSAVPPHFDCAKLLRSCPLHG